MLVLEEFDIPQTALETKSWYRERPGSEIIPEIKEFVAAGNWPFLWSGHTHTQPPRGAVPVYIDELFLKNPSPCPCCTPRTAKWKKAGKIAWFPEEGVIRIIGPDCFRALNPEGHDQAVADLRREQTKQQDVRYLLANIGVVPHTLRAIHAASNALNAWDEFAAALRSIIGGLCPKPLDSDP